MTREKQFGGLNYFKMAAAFLVTAIHTSPLASFSGEADFLFTRVAARTAVPFFFMVTGYFLLPQYLFRHSMDKRPLLYSLKKHLLLYMAAALFYLPVNLYAGQFEGLSAGGFLRMFFTDGTFYHLWYLTAALSGILIVWFLGRKLPFKIVAGITAALYVIGLLGDSYYGLTMQIPFLTKAYDVIFTVSAYTRNGLFYAPLFLVTGAGIHGSGYDGRISEKKDRRKNVRKDAAGFIVSFALMTTEGIFLRRLNLQRHDSMYVMLPPVMFFLFRLLLSGKKRRYGVPSSLHLNRDMLSGKRLRRVSTGIYIFHPICIILVRGAAKAAHMEGLFVENSLIHYLAVCTVSLAGAGAAAVAAEKIRRRETGFGRGIAFGVRSQNFDKGRAWIELSRENLVNNVETLQRLLVPGQQLMPVVKANAYGHGAALIARELQGMGIDAFAVACISEGVDLRKNGITGDILILGYTHPREFPMLHKYRLTQTVVDHAYGELLNSCGKKLNVHLKIDTGMRRLGERPEKSEEIDRIFRLKNLRVEGIYTHLCADETKKQADRAFTKKQAELFYGVAEKLEGPGISGVKMHLLASCGLLNYPELGGDYVRTGIALYGVLSERNTDKTICGSISQTAQTVGKDSDIEEEFMPELLPVLSLRARIAVVKDLYQGETVGYGLDYRAASDRKIAVLAIGYADGLPRSLSNGRGRALIHGQNAPVIGRICMDQTIVDVTGISDVKTGETAVLLGGCGDAEITAYEWADAAGTITNEILSRLGTRLPRIMAE